MGIMAWAYAVKKGVSQSASRARREETASGMRVRRPACAAALSGSEHAGTLQRRQSSGQMTVELAAALPVLIIVAVIAVNACTFMGDCAVFDRVARQAVRVHAAAPAYRQGVDQSCALIQSEIEDALDADNVSVSVTCTSAGMNMERFTATVEYAPTLFGLGLRSSVFGVQLPCLSHSTSLVVDVYKPGVVI